MSIVFFCFVRIVFHNKTGLDTLCSTNCDKEFNQRHVYIPQYKVGVGPACFLFSLFAR